MRATKKASALAEILADLENRPHNTSIVCCDLEGRTIDVVTLDGHDHWPEIKPWLVKVIPVLESVGAVQFRIES